MSEVIKRRKPIDETLYFVCWHCGTEYSEKNQNAYGTMQAISTTVAGDANAQIVGLKMMVSEKHICVL